MTRFDSGGFDQRQILETTRRLADGRHPDEPKIISRLKPVRADPVVGRSQAGIPIWKSKYYNRFWPVLATMIYVKSIAE